MQQVKGAGVRCLQLVFRSIKRLVEVKIDVASVDGRTGQPSRVPEYLKLFSKTTFWSTMNLHSYLMRSLT